MEWYCKRGDTGENRIKDLKIGFGMEYMPCGSFHANAVFFAIGALTYNPYLGFRARALKKMGAFASADRALAVVSDAGQDRSPWPADVLEDQHRHVRYVRRDPRALCVHHAGRINIGEKCLPTVHTTRSATLAKRGCRKGHQGRP